MPDKNKSWIQVQMFKIFSSIVISDQRMKRLSYDDIWSFTDYIWDTGEVPYFGDKESSPGKANWTLKR